MEIVSYNVNGIRAALKKGFLEWLASHNPSIICIQETKAQESQIDTPLFEELGYHCYWFSAEKKGYSGVGILTKEKPENIEYGIGMEKFDKEGRNLRADFKNFSVMSMYLPSGTNTDRLEYKFEYMDTLHTYLSDLKKTFPNLIVCGDYNICHQAIDIHDPVRNVTVSGFLPEERAWLDTFVENGFVDSFRYLNKSPHQYSWWSYRANARNNNKGWRLDYAMVTMPLKQNIENVDILNEIKHSDHCPISVTLKL